MVSVYFSVVISVYFCGICIVNIGCDMFGICIFFTFTCM